MNHRTHRQPARPAGHAAKADAHAILEANRVCILLQARRALLLHLIEHQVCTIDDVRDQVDLPRGTNPKVFGPTASPLAAAGIIAADGFVKSRRPESHARPVHRWRLLDRVAAKQWLRDHPEPASMAATDQPTAGSQRTMWDLDAESATSGGF